MSVLLSVDEDGWTWSRDGVEVRATNPTWEQGSIRALVHVRNADGLVDRDRVLLTSRQQRDRYVDRLADKSLELGPSVLLALEEAIREKGDPGPSEGQDAGQGRTLALEDPDPWPEPVDGPALLDDLTEWIAAHLHLHAHGVRAVALWAVATWFVNALYFAPPLVLQSPTKRAGKTLLLDLLRWIVRRGYLTSGIGVTLAVLFRLNEAHRPTMLIDEAERLGGAGADRDLVGLLNQGYRRGATVSRCEGDDHTVVTFDAFGFRALAAIGSLWDTIEDRAVSIRLQRKPKDVTVRRFNARRVEREGRELAQRIARFVADHADAVAEAEESAPRPAALDDRSCDSWAPLFAVAAIAGGPWPERALEAAKELSATGRDEDRAEQIIHDLRAIFEDHHNPEAISSGDVVQKLNAIETSPWGDYRKGDGITPHKLAAMLRPFEVRPHQGRTSGGSRVRGWWYGDLEPLFTRYPPKTPPGEVVQLVQSNDGAGPERFGSGTGNPGCTTSGSTENPCESTDVPVVPVQDRVVEDTHPPDGEKEDGAAGAGEDDGCPQCGGYLRHDAGPDNVCRLCERENEEYGRVESEAIQAESAGLFDGLEAES